MSEFTMKLQILARAELALARIQMRRAAKRTVFIGTALVFFVFAVVMFTVAAYHALVPRYGPSVAALVIAVIDIAVAALILLAASRTGSAENDEKLALEIRDLAYGEINRDVEQVRAELVKIRDDIHKIHSSLASFSSAAGNTLASLFGMLTKIGKRS